MRRAKTFSRREPEAVEPLGRVGGFDRWTWNSPPRLPDRRIMSYVVADYEISLRVYSMAFDPIGGSSSFSEGLATMRVFLHHFISCLSFTCAGRVAAGHFLIVEGAETPSGAFKVDRSSRRNPQTNSDENRTGLALRCDRLRSMRWSMNWNVSSLCRPGQAVRLKTDLTASGQSTSRRLVQTNAPLSLQRCQAYPITDQRDPSI